MRRPSPILMVLLLLAPFLSWTLPPVVAACAGLGDSACGMSSPGAICAMDHCPMRGQRQGMAKQSCGVSSAPQLTLPAPLLVLPPPPAASVMDVARPELPIWAPPAGLELPGWRFPLFHPPPTV